MGTNERGAVHIISLMVFVLALFGAWFLYDSFQQKRLQASVMEAVNGYRQIIESAIRDPQDRTFTQRYLQGDLEYHFKESKRASDQVEHSDSFGPSLRAVCYKPRSDSRVTTPP